MKKFLPALWALMVLTALGSCREGDSDQSILAVVESNVAAMNGKDLEAYMSTLHPEAPHYQATREHLARLFEHREFRVELLEARVVEKSKDLAGVRYVQIVRETDRGRPARDVKRVGYLVMKKSRGAWKILDSRVIEEAPLEP